MLVSLLVGAVRNQIETNFDPLSMLQSLNRRLLGRSHAQATCLALRLTPDGAVTLANAGHLPPYRNGKEIPMEGALPLGLMEHTDFSVMQFQLRPGDRLTLLTDGVIEAQNKKKELFGFDRTNELMQQEKSAAEVAAAVQSFGQQDDLTVLRIVRDQAVTLIAGAEFAEAST
ncbi:MAG: PP2C family protein-serine/threonine phosphatase [Acidobacteriaceae bacterium]